MRERGGLKIYALSKKREHDGDNTKITIHGNIVSRETILRDGNVSSTSRVVCLPDTIEPRGPKR